VTCVRALVSALALGTVAVAARAEGCGWTRIDHELGYSNSGAWNSNVYRGIFVTLTVAQAGGALWEGAESRFGRTMWQSIDAEVISDAAAFAGKKIFSRARPGQGNSPCDWFEHGSNYSFPSGEAAVAAGLIAPYVFEYGRDHPAVYSLLIIPAYVGVARMKNQSHWQSDVIGGWVVGGLSGWYAHSRDQPLIVSLLPHGVFVGLRKHF
jgi:membrane-associated phospholipid phosphatase